MSKPDISGLPKKLESLQERTQQLANKINEAIPLTGRSLEQQQEFLSALTHLGTVSEMFKSSRPKFRLFDWQKSGSEFSDFAKAFIDKMIAQLGVSAEAAYLSSAKDLIRTADEIEALLLRAEKSLAAATA